MRTIEKEIAISVFNYYKINPTDEDNSKRVNYKEIRKVKIQKPKRKLKAKLKTEGEHIMKNPTLITEKQNYSAVKMNPIQKAEASLKEELNLLKEKMNSITTVTKEIYKETKKISESKRTSEQKEIITAYEESEKIQTRINDIFNKIEKLKPFQVAVDAGKYNTKLSYVNDDEDIYTNDLFESRVQRSSECRHDGGKKFFVGPSVYSTSGVAKRVTDKDIVQSSNIEPMPHTKAHEYHRILMLKALYNIYQATGRTVFNLVVGTSIDTYNEDEGAQVYLTMLDEELPKEEKEKVLNAKTLKEKHNIYKEYVKKLKSEFIIKEFIVRESNGDAVRLIINDLYIAPETVTGATMIEVEDLTHAIVLDIGGHNETALPIVNGQPKFDAIYSNKNGMSKKYEKIAAWLVSKSSEISSADKDSVEVMLNNRDTMLDKNTDELIRDCVFSMLDDLTHHLKTNTIALEEGITTLVCIGGGSQVLAPYLEEYYSTVCDLRGKLHIADKDGIYSNVNGMFESGVNHFDERDYIREQFYEVC